MSEFQAICFNHPNGVLASFQPALIIVKRGNAQDAKVFKRLVHCVEDGALG